MIRLRFSSTFIVVLEMLVLASMPAVEYKWEWEGAEGKVDRKCIRV